MPFSDVHFWLTKISHSTLQTEETLHSFSLSIIPPYPTICSMAISGKMAKNMVLTYLHFRNLEFPLIGWFAHSDQSQITFCQAQTKIYRDAE